jgi:PhnB protein
MVTKEQKVTPYLTVSDAAKALAFLKEGLGAKIVSKMPAEDGKRLLHAEAVINGHSVFLSDDFPEWTGGRTPEKLGGTPVNMHVTLKRPKDVDVWVERAAKAGAKITHPPEDMFWGDRFAKVTDPLGHDWGFGAPLPKAKAKPKALTKSKAKPLAKPKALAAKTKAKPKPAAKRGRKT